MQTIDNLVKILEQQTSIYSKILKISKDKTDIIINGKADELEEITKLEHTLVYNIAKLEGEREGLVNEIVKQLGITSDYTALSDLIERMDRNEAEKLEACRKRISGILIELKGVNELNSRLIKNSLEYVEFSLNLLSSTQVSDNNYGNSGKVDGSKKRNFFDVKL